MPPSLLWTRIMKLISIFTSARCFPLVAFDLMATATRAQLAHATGNKRGNAAHGPFVHLFGLALLP
uniref:Uncharacterized protein n=1 Tax=Arundo donax TaxID=35708 RepID=A0A0A9TH66_ARUDO